MTSFHLTCINLQGERTQNWALCKESELLGVPRARGDEAIRATAPKDIIFVWKTGGLRAQGGLLAMTEVVGDPRRPRATDPWVNMASYGCVIPAVARGELTPPAFADFPDHGPNRFGIENGWVTRSWASITDPDTIQRLRDAFTPSDQIRHAAAQNYHSTM